ncbi:MAG: lactonase family protein [Pseudomonadales bacterium]
MLMLAGTYTRDTASKGIYSFKYDANRRALELLTTNADIENPSYLLKHPSLDIVYCVNEVRDFGGDKEGSGAVSAYSVSSTGVMEMISQVSSLGMDPCHLVLGPDASTLMVSNYSSGCLAAFPLNESGDIQQFSSFIQHRGKGVDPMRQKGSHVHSINFGRDGSSIYVADLGIDQIVRYPIDGLGQIDTNKRKNARLRSGAGPRHFCFDTAFEYCYVINELDNTVVTFGLDDGGALVELVTHSTLPDDCEEASYCAEILLSPDERYIYCSNRGDDSITVFEVGEEGQMRMVQNISSGGLHPRHFTITPDGEGLIVANRDSNNLVVFSRNVDSGTLVRTDNDVSVPAPVCVRFV